MMFFAQAIAFGSYPTGIWAGFFVVAKHVLFSGLKNRVSNVGSVNRISSTRPSLPTGRRA